MADNFNLRQFLTENKLTKNAKLLKEQVSLNGKPVNIGSIEIDGIDRNDHPDYVDAYITYAEYEDGTPLTDEELMSLEDDNYGLTGELIHDRQLYLQEKKEEGLDEADWRNNPYTPHNFDGVAAEAKKHKHLMKIANELFPQYGGNLENFKPLSPLEREQVYRQYTDDTRVIPFKESKLTAKERRLVEMVQVALEEEDNIDYTMGRHNDPDQLPNPPAQLNIPEGEEMVKEKPLPKYENIEKLMQEIEHGTNEAAYKHKMAKMKEVAEMLEARVGSLEEGDGAEFVDTKKVKQMKKDIMTLRKQAEKLEKEYDKKFGEKKSKKETQTENKMKDFDLRKFLTENKLTAGSRMLNEKLSYDDFEQMIKPFLDLAKSKGWVWNSSGNSWYTMISPAIALFHKDVLPTTKDGEYKGQPTELGTNPVAVRSINVSGPLETKSADVIMSPDYDMEQAWFSAKDKTILDSIKGAMANNTDVIQDIKQTSSEFTTSGDFEPQNYYVMLLRKKGA